MSLEQVFDSWFYDGELSKARKAKGLGKWGRLAHMASKLAGKSQKEISFTCGHPNHPGSVHVLGSVVGNLHFLMGYGNPSFHYAPYHVQVIDPNLDEETAQKLYDMRGHPSMPDLWDLPSVDDEGDMVEGEPHPTISDVKSVEFRARLRAKESITVNLGAGSYTAVPSEGLVYGTHNNHVYKWSMVKNSFLAAAHPELSEAMNAAETPAASPVEKSFYVPESVKHKAAKYQSEQFEEEVFPLLKSVLPRPGSVVPIRTESDETIYGVVGSDSIQFLDRAGSEVSISVFDMAYKSFDLATDGNIHMSILYNLGCMNFGLHDFDEYLTKDNTVAYTSVVKGEPTPGFEDLDEGDISKAVKDVEYIDGTFRLVLRGDV